MENGPILAPTWAESGAEPSSEPRTAAADITPSLPQTESWQIASGAGAKRVGGGAFEVHNLSDVRRPPITARIPFLFSTEYHWRRKHSVTFGE